MVMNALAGTAVGLTYGLTLKEIQTGIESLQSLSGRFHIIETENYTIIDDCYNANPVSMKASLEVLQDGGRPITDDSLQKGRMGRRVAILGDMFELGEEELKLHRSVGQFAGSCKLEKLIAVGERCLELAAGAREENPDLEIVHYDTLEELLKHLHLEVQCQDTILVKASHGMEFGKLIERLQEKTL